MSLSSALGNIRELNEAIKSKPDWARGIADYTSEKFTEGGHQLGGALLGGLGALAIPSVGRGPSGGLYPKPRLTGDRYDAARSAMSPHLGIDIEESDRQLAESRAYAEDMGVGPFALGVTEFVGPEPFDVPGIKIAKGIGGLAKAAPAAATAMKAMITPSFLSERPRRANTLMEGIENNVTESIAEILIGQHPSTATPEDIGRYSAIEDILQQLGNEFEGGPEAIRRSLNGIIKRSLRQAAHGGEGRVGDQALHPGRHQVLVDNPSDFMGSLHESLKLNISKAMQRSEAWRSLHPLEESYDRGYNFETGEEDVYYQLAEQISNLLVERLRREVGQLQGVGGTDFIDAMQNAPLSPGSSVPGITPVVGDIYRSMGPEGIEEWPLDLSQGEAIERMSRGLPRLSASNANREPRRTDLDFDVSADNYEAMDYGDEDAGNIVSGFVDSSRNRIAALMDEIAPGHGLVGDDELVAELDHIMNQAEDQIGQSAHGVYIDGSRVDHEGRADIGAILDEFMHPHQWQDDVLITRNGVPVDRDRLGEALADHDRLGTRASEHTTPPRPVLDGIVRELQETAGRTGTIPAIYRHAPDYPTTLRRLRENGEDRMADMLEVYLEERGYDVVHPASHRERNPGDMTPDIEDESQPLRSADLEPSDYDAIDDIMSADLPGGSGPSQRPISDRMPIGHPRADELIEGVNRGDLTSIHDVLEESQILDDLWTGSPAEVGDNVSMLNAAGIDSSEQLLDEVMESFRYASYDTGFIAEGRSPTPDELDDFWDLAEFAIHSGFENLIDPSAGGTAQQSRVAERVADRIMRDLSEIAQPGGRGPALLRREIVGPDGQVTLGPPTLPGDAMPQTDFGSFNLELADNALITVADELEGILGGQKLSDLGPGDRQQASDIIRKIESTLNDAADAGRHEFVEYWLNVKRELESVAKGGDEYLRLSPERSLEDVVGGDLADRMRGLAED